MKKKILLLSAFAVISPSLYAQVVYGTEENMYVKSMYDNPISHIDNPEEPVVATIEEPRYQLSGLTDNWFVSAQTGFLSFLGSPVTHTDFSGRTKIGFDFSLGKWHSPYFGTRLVYQGFKFIDSQKSPQSFGSYHIDALFNVSSFFRPSFDTPAKWNISPYLGVGLIRHNNLKHSAFAFSYGITGSYNLNERIALSATLGGTTTHGNFDGYGSKKHFGDNLLSGTIGITVGIGHLGWHRKGQIHSTIANEEIITHPTAINIPSYPRNSYNGLRSLQERIANGEGKDGTNRIDDDNIAKFDAPILFFFKRNSTELIDKQQFINIREIAAAVREYDLDVRIVGSADSKTGTSKHNRTLSIKRCRYIAKLLLKAGVPRDKMTASIKGGNSYYKPYTANRHTCVMLYKKK